MADRAVIAYVRGTLVHGEFCESLVSVAMEARTRVDAVLRYVSGPNISTPRNLIVREFLDSYTAPWLWMLDTDMVFKANALDRLIRAADVALRPVVGALCYSQNDGAADPYPTMYELTEKEPGVMAFARYKIWPENTCMRVSATGAACLLMHRQALAAVEKASNDPAAPWFRESAVGAPLALMAEDLTFCLRCAAAQVPVHVHTGIQVGHVKPVMLGKIT